MRIVAFGGNGRLGSAFQRLWQEATFIIPERDLLLTDEAVVRDYLSASGADWVINLIAYNAVDKAETEPEEAMRVNRDIPAVLARTCASLQLSYLFFSTDYVFAGKQDERYTEDAPTSPINMYGASKAAGEAAVLTTYPQAVIVRTSRLYGPPARSSTAKPSFIDLIIRDAKNAKQFGVNQAEVASPTFVDDLARHVWQYIILNKEAAGIYHMTQTGGVTWFAWAQAIIDELRLPVSIFPRDPATLARPAQRPPFLDLVSTRIPPMPPWRDALHRFLSQQTEIREAVIACHREKSS